MNASPEPIHTRCDVDGRVIVLDDGASLVVRPLRNGDTRRVEEVFEALGERSRLARFGTPKPRLTRGELEYLSDVDHESHEALLALDPRSGRAIAVVRFVRDGVNRGAAEVAFAVADAWQSRGLGSRMAGLLACRAREVGVERLSAHVQSENHASQSLVRRMGRVVRTRHDGAWLELVAALD
jgi:RimJ/RimL family protein N-acetyltransferase